MIANEDVQLAKDWLQQNCPRAHIRATLNKGLSFVEALEKAGLSVESVDGTELYAFLSAVADTPAYRKHFVQPQL